MGFWVSGRKDISSPACAGHASPLLPERQYLTSIYLSRVFLNCSLCAQAMLLLFLWRSCHWPCFLSVFLFLCAQGLLFLLFMRWWLPSIYHSPVSWSPFFLFCCVCYGWQQQSSFFPVLNPLSLSGFPLVSLPASLMSSVSHFGSVFLQLLAVTNLFVFAINLFYFLW